MIVAGMMKIKIRDKKGIVIEDGETLVAGKGAVIGQSTVLTCHHIFWPVK
jgi:hypothetical protein